MNALYLPKQVTQNVTPPPHSATVWADINGKLWFQLPDQAPTQINTGNNALVPSDAPIQPPQAFVDNIAKFQYNADAQTGNVVDISNQGITSLDYSSAGMLFKWANGVGNTFGAPTLNAGGNPLVVDTVNGVLALFVANQGTFGGVGPGTIILGGAAPIGQGITDKATLIGAGWTVTTNS